MKPSMVLTHLENVTAWEDILGDVLDVKHQATLTQRQVLLEQLKSRGIREQEVQIHTVIGIDGCLIVIDPKDSLEECWIYHMHEKQLKKFKLLDGKIIDVQTR